tara:strand:- start:326 stop:1135 length:810 start_codon:yes stop_codon:yes gene_type:complete
MANMAQYIFGWQNHIDRGIGAEHSHHEMELVYHQTGVGEVYCEHTQKICFQPGDLQIIPARQSHQQKQLQPGLDHCILLTVSRSLAERINHQCCYPLVQATYPITELATLSVIPKPQNQAEQDIANHRLTAALLEILRLGQRFEPQAKPTTRREETAELAHDYLRTHWRDIDQLMEVAEAMGISVDYLRHVYRENFGVTIYQALTQLRIDHACDLLRNSQLPLKALPEICGFADVQQFSRRFKQITGKAPGAYRKKSQVTSMKNQPAGA